jgi:hypothetical protein
VTSPLETLRALARRKTNECGQQSSVVNSSNSFSSYAGTLADQWQGRVYTYEKNEKKTEMSLKRESALNERNEFNEETQVARDGIDERAANIKYDDDALRTWAEGFDVLCTMPPPRGFSAGRWQHIVDAAGVFMERWADRATVCGWSTLDVFGCHPTRPDARFDCMGLVLLLDRCSIAGLDEGGADLVTATGAGQRYRRRPMPDAMPIWRLR